MSERPHQRDWRIAVLESGLPRTARLVGQALDTFMNGSGEAFPARGTVARRAGVSLSTARRALAELERADFVRVVHSSGRRPNGYRAVFPNRVDVSRLDPANRLTAVNRFIDSQPAHMEASTGSNQAPNRLTQVSHEIGKSVKSKSIGALTSKKTKTPYVSDLSNYTGCRHVYNGHAVHGVRDPLGTDRPQEGWPHPRPTRQEVAAALREHAAGLNGERR